MSPPTLGRIHSKHNDLFRFGPFALVLLPSPLSHLLQCPRSHWGSSFGGSCRRRGNTQGRLLEGRLGNHVAHRSPAPSLSPFTRSNRGSALPSTAVAWASRAMWNASSSLADAMFPERALATMA